MRRSVRFGTRARLLEEGQAVERSRRRLGMELDAREAVAGEPLAGAVVQRHVRDVVVGEDREAVVLDGDEHPAGREVAHRVVRAAVAERERERLVPECQPEQLVARQIPYTGTCPSSAPIVSTWPTRTAGSPGPFATRTARGRASRIASASHQGGRRTPRHRSRRGGAGSSASSRGRPRRRAARRRSSTAPPCRRRGRAGGRRWAARRARGRGASPRRRRRARSAAAVRVPDPLHECARVDPGQRDDPPARSQAANAGRASRMTTPSHCTRSDSIRACRRRRCRRAGTRSRAPARRSSGRSPPPRSPPSRS